MRDFESLSPQEVLALAVRIERANAARFRAFADSFRGYDDAVTKRFEELCREEEEHETLLLAGFRERFGEELPEIEETDVAGVIEAVDLSDAEHQLFDSLRPAGVYELALRAEEEARDFYRRAEASATDEDLKALYGDLAEAESDHVWWAAEKLQTAVAGGGER